METPTPRTPRPLPSNDLLAAFQRKQDSQIINTGITPPEHLARKKETASKISPKEPTKRSSNLMEEDDTTTLQGGGSEFEGIVLAIFEKLRLVMTTKDGTPILLSVATKRGRKELNREYVLSSEVVAYLSGDTNDLVADIYGLEYDTADFVICRRVDHGGMFIDSRVEGMFFGFEKDSESSAVNSRFVYSIHLVTINDADGKQHPGCVLETKGCISVVITDSSLLEMHCISTSSVGVEYHHDTKRLWYVDKHNGFVSFCSTEDSSENIVFSSMIDTPKAVFMPSHFSRGITFIHDGTQLIYYDHFSELCDSFYIGKTCIDTGTGARESFGRFLLNCTRHLDSSSGGLLLYHKGRHDNAIYYIPEIIEQLSRETIIARNIVDTGAEFDVLFEEKDGDSNEVFEIYNGNKGIEAVVSKDIPSLSSTRTKYPGSEDVVSSITSTLRGIELDHEDNEAGSTWRAPMQSHNTPSKIQITDNMEDDDTQPIAVAARTYVPTPRVPRRPLTVAPNPHTVAPNPNTVAPNPHTVSRQDPRSRVSSRYVRDTSFPTADSPLEDGTAPELGSNPDRDMFSKFIKGVHEGGPTDTKIGEDTFVLIGGSRPVKKKEAQHRRLDPSKWILPPEIQAQRQQKQQSQMQQGVALPGHQKSRPESGTLLASEVIMGIP